jgi:NTE family protein
MSARARELKLRAPAGVRSGMGAVQKPPDVLVLGAGGILGEAWMTGVLAGIEAGSGLDLRRCAAFVGTSAGSIVAAQLAGGVRPQVPVAIAADEPLDDDPASSGGSRAAQLATAARRGLAAASPFVPFALGAVAPGRALAGGMLLARLPRGEISLSDLGARTARTGARFDGRLRVLAVDLANGRRTVFGAPGAPAAGVPEAVQASCAVPGLFTPIAIRGREYVDGGVWSPTNLDVAPVDRGSHVVCLVPTAHLGARIGSPLAPLALLWRSALALEAAALRRRGATVEIVQPDAGAAGAMGEALMDPLPRRKVLAEGYRQGRRLAARGSEGRDARAVS